MEKIRNKTKQNNRRQLKNGRGDIFTKLKNLNEIKRKQNKAKNGLTEESRMRKRKKLKCGLRKIINGAEVTSGAIYEKEMKLEKRNEAM